MSLYFSRHTKLYLVQNTQADGLGSDNVWEIPVLDGFSFSQAINSSEVTLNEMETAAGSSRRGKQVFNDSFAPAEWSFSTYARPFKAQAAAVGGWEPTNANYHHAVEEPLWANFVAANNWSGSQAWTSGVVSDGTSMVIDFNDSNKAALGEFSLIFTLGGCAPGGTPLYYEIANACVNSVSIDFEIDGICTLNWSGYGKSIAETNAFDQARSNADPAGDVTIWEGQDNTDAFIRNRLTTLTAQADIAVEGQENFGNLGAYQLPLTGGSISFENNLTFLTPEELCSVNLPLRHVTGTRSVSGNFTCYLSEGTSDDGSSNLFSDLAGANQLVTNDFGLTFAIGGATAPYISINLAHAHLEIPTHSVEDVISVDVAFSGLPSDLDTADEAEITYVGA